QAYRLVEPLLKTGPMLLLSFVLLKHSLVQGRLMEYFLFFYSFYTICKSFVGFPLTIKAADFQHRVIHITNCVIPIDRFVLQGVERCSMRDPFRKIRIGNEEPTKGHGIKRALGHCTIAFF